MSSSSKFFAKKNGFYNKKKPVNVLTNPLATQSSSKSSSSFPNFLTEEYKHLICSNSYLGKKGYTVPKEFLVKDDLDFLYKDLFCKPVTFGPQVAQPECAFPVYKENAKKIYIPRFYGIERYGLPEKSEIEYGEQIDLTFEKPLRDYQDKIIDVYMKHVIKPSNSSAATNPSLHNSGGGILEVPCGRGKTVMALKIISLLKQKTLIIVHKEFLLNQWIDRIQEFLPGAKVGKIQGQIFDVECKDIVLGMLQTLYEKEFTIGDQTIAGPFASFGLTIIDEVHRIGSEQFSKTLLRVLTPYMLGISATVERKDKLTKILYMFIGPKIYTEKREDEDLVCVRAIEYASPDPEFNELVQDYKGNTQYSSMITKLCAFGPRCDFIVQVIADLVEESPDSQIMILAHNRCLLKYFYEAINHRKIAEVGYYVGGMKQKDLQTTENKQIVLATYAMAAEALDIKTLSTLIMATPKTDIIQSVGRILRVRHENPIVVDIVDSHDIFRNQWKQRKTFYKKCNYRIRSIPSNQYRGMATVDWLGNDQTWKRVFEPKQKAKVVESKVVESKVVESKNCTKVQNDLVQTDSDDDELPRPIKSINNGKCIIEFEDLDDEDNEYV